MDPRGPCTGNDVIPFFEYMVEINGMPLNSNIETIKEVLEQNQGKSIQITFFNYKTEEYRKRSVMLSED